MSFPRSGSTCGSFRRRSRGLQARGQDGFRRNAKESRGFVRGRSDRCVRGDSTLSTGRHAASTHTIRDLGDLHVVRQPQSVERLAVLWSMVRPVHFERSTTERRTCRVNRAAHRDQHGRRRNAGRVKGRGRSRPLSGNDTRSPVANSPERRARRRQRSARQSVLEVDAPTDRPPEGAGSDLARQLTASCSQGERRLDVPADDEVATAVMPNRCMRAINVVRGRPSLAAAPFRVSR